VASTLQSGALQSAAAVQCSCRYLYLLLRHMEAHHTIPCFSAPKIVHSCGDHGSHLSRGSLGPDTSVPDNIWVGSPIFCAISGVPNRQTDRQTDIEITLRATTAAIGRIYAMHWLKRLVRFLKHGVVTDTVVYC